MRAKPAHDDLMRVSTGEIALVAEGPVQVPELSYCIVADPQVVGPADAGTA